MPELEDPAEERFAQVVASGEGAVKAYAAAGFRGQDARLGAPSLMQDPLIRARIAELLNPNAEAALEMDLLKPLARVQALITRHRLIRRVLEERGADPAMQGVSGGWSGLVIRKWKQFGRGRNARLVPEDVFDVAALQELRAIERQIAWESAHSTIEDEAVSSASDFTEEELAQIENLTSKLRPKAA